MLKFVTYRFREEDFPALPRPKLNKKTTDKKPAKSILKQTRNQPTSQTHYRPIVLSKSWFENQLEQIDQQIEQHLELAARHSFKQMALRPKQYYLTN